MTERLKKSHPFALAIRALTLAGTHLQSQPYPLPSLRSVYSTFLISLEFVHFSHSSTPPPVQTITFSHRDDYLGPYLGSLPKGFALSTHFLAATGELQV